MIIFFLTKILWHLFINLWVMVKRDGKISYNSRAINHKAVREICYKWNRVSMGSESPAIMYHWLFFVRGNQLVGNRKYRVWEILDVVELLLQSYLSLITSSADDERTCYRRRNEIKKVFNMLIFKRHCGLLRVLLRNTEKNTNVGLYLGFVFI